MNRRDFLRRASAAAVGALAFDPERALWVPGAKTFFDARRPMRGGFTFEQIVAITYAQIVRERAQRRHNHFATWLEQAGAIRRL